MSKRHLPGRFPWSAQISRIGQRFLLPRRPNSKLSIALLAAASLAVAFSLAEARGPTHNVRALHKDNLIQRDRDYNNKPLTSHGCTLAGGCRPLVLRPDRGVKFTGAEVSVRLPREEIDKQISVSARLLREEIDKQREEIDKQRKTPTSVMESLQQRGAIIQW
jgi:hypothetical protein